MKMPKISCVTVTKGRYELLKKAIFCYESQTYPNKELIILSQANKTINDKIKQLTKDDIHLVEAHPSLSLGKMRNLSMELTTGDVICQWDDDDLCHPFRLSTQYHALISNNSVACCYRQHLKYYLHTGEIYWIDWGIEKREFEKYLPGTIMFWKKHFYDMRNILYPESGSHAHKEEDLCLLQRFLELGRIASVDAGNQYFYVYHGDNVYWLEHHNLVLAKRVLTKEELLARKDLLLETFRAVGIKEQVKVRSLQEVAFEA